MSARRSGPARAIDAPLRIGIDAGGTFTDFHVVWAGGVFIVKVASTPADPAAAVLDGLETVAQVLEGAVGPGNGPGVPQEDPQRRSPPARRSGGGFAEDAEGREARGSGPFWGRTASSRRASIVHGTTVGTNALLTRQVARTAFVTTAGFEDLVEIGRQNRDALYDLQADRPAPLVGRALRFGVNERVQRRLRSGLVSAGGRARVPGASSARSGQADVHGQGRRDSGLASQVPAFDEDTVLAASPAIWVRMAPARGELLRLLRTLRAQGVESIAIGFLHAYADPRNEIAAERVLERLGVPVTLSHRISGEYREYERFSTTIANAALQPVAGRYLARLAAGVHPAHLTILQSDGTTATAQAAAREPVRTVLSGPAGGALAAAALARRLGDRRLLSFDMGGTSTDAVLIDGKLPYTPLERIAGLPIRTPMVAVRTVGAGGGSIARRDAAGALRVGPESAGADPGPACYGKGEEPTVTDAHLVLGRLGPNDLLGGDFPVDRARSERALARLARGLGLSLERTAEGILRVAEATMERALREVSLEKGKDPRGYALYAFGGAGGLHACMLAERLGMRRVVIPVNAGVFSATGLAFAAAGVEVASTVLARTEDDERLRAEYRTLERKALARLREQGIGPRRAQLLRFADLRYAGQSHEITLPYEGDMARSFARAHKERYGHVRAKAPVEVVTLRLRALAAPPEACLSESPAAGLPPGWGRASGSRRDVRKDLLPRSATEDGGPPWRPTGALNSERHGAVSFAGQRVNCRVVARAALGRGRTLHGPARVTEYSATTFIPPGWEGSVGPQRAMILTPSKGRGCAPRRDYARDGEPRRR